MHNTVMLDSNELKSKGIQPFWFKQIAAYVNRRQVPKVNQWDEFEDDTEYPEDNFSYIASVEDLYKHIGYSFMLWFFSNVIPDIVERDLHEFARYCIYEEIQAQNKYNYSENDSHGISRKTITAMLVHYAEKQYMELAETFWDGDREKRVKMFELALKGKAPWQGGFFERMLHRFKLRNIS